MLEVSQTASHEYVECLGDKEGIWHHHTQYRIVSSPDAGEPSNSCSDPRISVPLSLSWSPELEVSLKYRLFFSTFESYRETPVDNESITGGNILLGNILDLNYIVWLFNTRSDFYFPFEVIIRQTVSLSLWRQQGFIDLSIDEFDRRRQFKIVNRVAAANQANADPSLNGYPQTIGNLDEEIIWEISMFTESRSESWQIGVDDISQPFRTESFSSMVSQALRSQSRPVLERIPAFLRQTHPESSGRSLKVIVTIPKVEPELEHIIDVTLCDPAGDLYYSVGYELDLCIRQIHLQLLNYGIPVGPETEVYQRVLGQLLLYRHYCASEPGYIDANVAQMTENKGFHVHLRDRLKHQLAIKLVAHVFSEVDIGNSRVDLLIENIPVELKLEDRKTATTDDIVERYQGQAADYIARQEAPFGFLMILDTVLDREQPTSRVEQDLRVIQVTNVSGGSIAVVAIVVRIPRPASDHTVLARQRT